MYCIGTWCRCALEHATRYAHVHSQLNNEFELDTLGTQDFNLEVYSMKKVFLYWLVLGASVSFFFHLRCS